MLTAARLGAPNENDRLAGVSKGIRAAMPWLDVGWRLIGSAVSGVALGYVTDRMIGSFPWGTVIGALVGIVLGFYAFFISVERLTRKEK